MVHLGSARASLNALKGNYSAQLKIHKEVLELSDGYRRASVHGDRTEDDGRDSPEPSGDADGAAHPQVTATSGRIRCTRTASARILQIHGDKISCASATNYVSGVAYERSELSPARILRGQSTKLH